MSSITEYIESGILEMYVMGVLSPRESMEVQQMAASHPEVLLEIKQIEYNLQSYSENQTPSPHPAIKPLLLATIDYTERLQSGEVQTFPPELNSSSKISDYNEWLLREDMILPDDFDQMYAKIISFTPEMTSAIVWISSLAPHEVHDDEYEKFLIVEGSCDITIGEKVHSLVAGDYLAIPLYEGHNVKVTSSVPCKVILQRVAA
jgi:mannose-6-phosphate isomerase-like protein (cupin superfamily)